MGDNGDFREEEHSDADVYNDGFAHRNNAAFTHRNICDYADDGGGHGVPFEARVITKLRTNDPSLFPNAGSNHKFGIRPSVPDPIRVELAEALTQNTVVRRIMLQPHHYSKLPADAMAKYLIQSKRLLRVDLMGVSPTLSDFLPGRSFGPTFQLCTFVEAIGQSTSVKHLSLMNLDLGPASESFESLLT
jgi:hypothetical protein